MTGVFDQCDADTTAVIDAAVGEARGFGHSWLGTEHLLVALAARTQALPEPVAGLLPDGAAVRSALTAALGQPPGRDVELLKAVGVDLDQVRSSVRRTFGDEAVDRLGRRRVHQPWQPWRRPSRRCTSLLAGTLEVAPRAKQALERARAHAQARELPAIDPASLLLGMVEVKGAVSNRLLRDLEVDPERLRRALHTGP